MNETREAAREWVRKRNNNWGEVEPTKATPTPGSKDSSHHATTIFVEANSEEMTALKGQSPATPTPIGGWIEMIKEEKDVVLRGSARQIKYQ